MVALPHSPAVHIHRISTAAFGKTAEKLTFPRGKFPPLSDYAEACRALIGRTFPASSRHAVAKRADTETGHVFSIDKFERVLAGETRSPDGYMMRCVMQIAASRGIDIPPALAVRPAVQS